MFPHGFSITDFDFQQQLRGLSTGALVEQIHLKGDRLQYKLLTGEGELGGSVEPSMMAAIKRGYVSTPPRIGCNSFHRG